MRIGQTVIGMRVERNVNDHIACASPFGQVTSEVLRRLADVETPCPVVEDFVRGEQSSLPLVDLLTVIGQRPVKGATYVNFGNHCC